MSTELRSFLTDECGYYVKQIASTDNPRYAINWSRDIGQSAIVISTWEVVGDNGLEISEASVDGAVVSAKFKSDAAGEYCVFNKIQAGGEDLTMPFRIIVLPACACQP